MKPDKALIEVLIGAARAHQKATGQPFDLNPDWAKWYAQHLLGSTNFNQLTERDWHMSELAEALSALDTAYRRARPRASWAEYYAGRLSN